MAISRRRALVGIASLATLAAGGRFAARADGGAGEPPRLTGAETRRLVEKREAILLDVRSRSSYEMQHAEGAVHIPLGELEARFAELPKDKLIAAYCT